MQQTARRGEQVLIVESGSGIPSVLAVMSKEAVRVVGRDIEAEDVQVGRENTRRNGVESRL